MNNIDIKQGVEKIADGEISKADAIFVKGMIDIINTDKSKNYVQEFIKDNKKTYEDSKNCINESLQNYINSGQCEDKVLPEVQNFINRLNNEYTNTTPSVNDKIEINKPYEPIYTKDKPLESMVTNLNNILPEDKRLPEATEMRKNMKDNIMNKIDIYLNSIKDKGNQGLLKNHIKKWFDNELTDKRIDNLITGGLYVSINNIDKQINAPESIKIDNISIVGVHLFKDIKDINSLLSTNGDRLKNILSNVEDKITARVKQQFSKGEILFKSNEVFQKELSNISNERGINKDVPESISLSAKTDNPIYKLFQEDIKIDDEKSAIKLIQENSKLKNSINEDDISSPQKIQEALYKKANNILSQIPLDPHEKESFKTGLMQNKISGWPKDIVKGFFDLLKGTKLFELFKGLFGGTLDKLFLSKARNDAQEGVKVYEENKKDFTLSAEDITFLNTINNQDFKNIIINTSSQGVYKTLVLSKKYIIPENTTTKDHQNKFLDKNGVYNEGLVTKEFESYKNMVEKNRNNKITSKMVDAKGKEVASGGTEKSYTYADIIKSEKDLIENFFQYVQTGEKPENYKDKGFYEDLKTPWGHNLDITNTGITAKTDIVLPRNILALPDPVTLLNIPTNTPPHTVEWEDKIDLPTGKITGTIKVTSGPPDNKITRIPVTVSIKEPDIATSISTAKKVPEKKGPIKK